MNLRPYRFAPNRHFNGGHTTGPVLPMEEPRPSLRQRALAWLERQDREQSAIRSADHAE